VEGVLGQIDENRLKDGHVVRLVRLHTVALDAERHIESAAVLAGDTLSFNRHVRTLDPSSDRRCAKAPHHCRGRVVGLLHYEALEAPLAAALVTSAGSPGRSHVAVWSETYGARPHEGEQPRAIASLMTDAEVLERCAATDAPSYR
jgi:hypothetical protein